MKLKCQLAGANCPPYSHNGQFHPNNTTITALLPDLHRCANCIAFSSPSVPAFRDDLIQIASITLIKKGPTFNPTHQSGASFGSFIRPRICGSLMYAKHKELKQLDKETPESYIESDFNVAQNAKVKENIIPILNVRDPKAEFFVDELIWEISVANFKQGLPQLLETLTDREKQVFDCLLEEMPNRDIAKMLQLSPPRISQLAKNVINKLRVACQRFGLTE